MIRTLKNKHSVILLAAIAVVILCIAAVVIWGTTVGASDTATAEVPAFSQTAQKDPGSGGKILDVEREILIKNVSEGIHDMGLLVTQEYYFTDAVTQSKVKTFFNIPLGFTETTYVATYDGVVTAGIDFTRVGVDIDIHDKTVTVTMPEAEIQSVDVDPNSFVLYSEKNGLGNPLSISDFNGSIVELENKARNRALERGLLDQAEENARRVVGNFIGGFLDLTKYDILWETK